MAAVPVIQTAVINAASAGDNTIVAAQGAGKSIVVLNHCMTCAASSVGTWKSGSTAISGAMTYGAGVSSPPGFITPQGWIVPQFKTAANEALVLNATTSLQGWLVYTVVDA